MSKESLSTTTIERTVDDVGIVKGGQVGRPFVFDGGDRGGLMPIFGSHLSIAGGYYKAAVEAARLGFNAVQIFTKNNNQWAGKPITNDDVTKFQEALRSGNIKETISHDSYLINLGSPDDALWAKSIDAMTIELERADRLGIKHVVAHPGSHLGTGEEVGLERVAAGLDAVLQRTSKLKTTVSLETTAGQGTNLGYRFEHLGRIIQLSKYPDRLTACLDTAMFSRRAMSWLPSGSTTRR